MMSDLLQDTQVVWRGLVRQRTFALSVTSIIAVAVGLLAAVYTLAEPFLLKRLPYARPGEIVAITVRAERVTAVSQVPTLDEWRARTDLFTDIASVGNGTYQRVRQQDASVMLYVIPVSANILDVLGVSTLDGPSVQLNDPSAVLLTRRGSGRLGESSDVGRALQLQDGTTLRIAGILPAHFLVPRDGFTNIADGLKVESVGPVASVAVRGGRPAEGRGHLVARLQPGVTAAQIEASLSDLHDVHRQIVVGVAHISEHLRGEARRETLVAVAAGLFILLIAAANVANLAAVRIQNRRDELAIRRALGASRLRIVRLLALELGALSAVGIVLGLAGARGALSAAAGMIPRGYVALGEPALTWTTAGVVIAVTSLLLILTGLPAARRPLRGALVEDLSLTQAGRQSSRFGFIAVQTGFAMLLAIGGALLGESYRNLVAQRVGVDRQATSVIASYPPALRGAPLLAVLDDSLARLRSIPGITDAAYTQGTVVDGAVGFRAANAIWIAGEMVESDVKPVTAGLFDLAGFRITAGRPLRDGDENYRAIVINDVLAARHFKETRPIGQIVTVANRPARVVGVMTSVFDRALDLPPRPAVYHLMAPASGALVTYVVRVVDDGEVPAGEIQRTLWSIMPDVIVVQVATLGELLRASVLDRTFAAAISLSFALVGLIVALAGVAGLVSVIVTERRHEMAIRLALGASVMRVRRMVMSRVMLAAFTGIALGTLTGRIFSTLLDSLVYGVSPHSWPPIVMAAAIVLLLTAAAAVLPTRRISMHTTTRLMRTH